MIDIKVLAIKDLLPISDARYANITPRSLIIEGRDFTRASEVLINDQNVPEFMIISSHQIIAQIPNAEVNKVLTKVSVLATTPSPSERSLLQFTVGHTISKLEGLERLVQLFCKLLLQTPGSDKFNQGAGGGLLRIIGSNFIGDSAKNIQADAVTAVNRTRDQILALQTRNTRIPSDERLLVANLDSIGFNSGITTLLMRVSIAAASGRQAVANLSF